MSYEQTFGMLHKEKSVQVSDPEINSGQAPGKPNSNSKVGYIIIFKV